jgi:hypothetical protein
MYIPRNWKFGSAFSKPRNFGEWGVVELPPPPAARPCTEVGKKDKWQKKKIQVIQTQNLIVKLNRIRGFKLRT